MIKKLERYLDLIVPYKTGRWVFSAILLLLFYVRCIYKGGYVAVAYLLSFQILQKGILFITPKGIPSIVEDQDDDNLELPGGYLGKMLVKKVTEMILSL